MLREAGWDVLETDGDIQPSKAGIEIGSRGDAQSRLSLTLLTVIRNFTTIYSIALSICSKICFV